MLNGACNKSNPCPNNHSCVDSSGDLVADGVSTLDDSHVCKIDNG